MYKHNTPLEVYKLLPKSNCKQCQLHTCLAFATAVIKGEKNLNDCPHLDSNIIKRFEGEIVKPMTFDQRQEQFLESLQKEICTIDFSLSAERLGASLSAGKLKIKSLGKYFFINSKGKITSDCHLNSWVTVPLLNYIISCKGSPVSGEWIPFRELKNGKAREPLFEKKCEETLKQIADKHLDLFKNIIYVFGGRPAVNTFSADISLSLYPLPKVPILINYCKPEDELPSKLNIFFDKTAEDNLNIESIYRLCMGIVTMFEKITISHT